MNNHFHFKEKLKFISVIGNSGDVVLRMAEVDEAYKKSKAGDISLTTHIAPDKIKEKSIENMQKLG
jgi:hypothetical protein